MEGHAGKTIDAAGAGTPEPIAGVESRIPPFRIPDEWRDGIDGSVYEVVDTDGKVLVKYGTAEEAEAFINARPDFTTLRCHIIKYRYTSTLIKEKKPDE